MQLEHGLRERFLFASLLISVTLIAGFGLAIFQFIEVIEEDYVSSEMRAEFERFVTDFRNHRALPGALPRGFEGFVTTAEDEHEVPAVLRALEPGIHTDVDIEGREFSVGKRELGEATVYLVQDLGFEPIELLEQRLIQIALWAGVSAVLVGLALSLWLATLIAEPVQRLAAAVAVLVPGQPRAALNVAGSAREIRVIARAFDHAIERFDEFAARERAFTRDASHELRTPLAVISSSAQLLAEDPQVSAAGAARLERLRVAASQMEALLDALLFLARGDGALDSAAVDVGELINDAIRILTSAGGPQTPEIRLTVASQAQVRVPRGLLLCVVNNLLGNAIAHAASETIDVTVNATGIVIEDCGRGIGADLLPQLFEVGVRGSHSAGQGLGLDLVRRICERLGWRLIIDSRAGHGTRFVLDLAPETPLP